MNLKEIISSEMSRKNTDYVKGILLENKSLFEGAFNLVLLNEEPVSRRAIWAIDAVSESNPQFMLPYLEKLIEQLPYFKHDGLKRHTLRILSRFAIPEKKEIELLEICLGFIKSEKESIAARYYAMEVLYNFSEKENDLKYELLTVLELIPENKSAGLKNHFSKLTLKLRNELKNNQT